MKEEIVQYYNQLAEEYDKDRFSNTYGQYIHKQEIHVLEKYLAKDEITHTLDLACGTGRFLEYANFGIDISEKMTEISKGKFPSKNITVGDAESLPFEDSFFQNIISFHLFMHLDLKSSKTILDEVHRVLKKGGYFIFDIPSEKRRKITGYSNSSWHGANQISSKKLQKLIDPEWELISFHGIAFFPIHRIPEKMRRPMIKLDNLLGNSLLKEYSSHLIFVLKKK